MKLLNIISGLTIFTALMSFPGEAFARKKQNVKEEPAEPPVPEMRIDPNLIKSYQDGASTESERIEKVGVQILAIEPSFDLHQFKTFKAHNDYFEIPLSGGASSAIAPAVWVGHPTGAVWFGMIRARAGLDFSYLGYDGAQAVYQRSLKQDFRDNISAHVLPVIATARLGTSGNGESSFGVSPWISLGSGMMLTQVAGNLDGISQSGWSPVTKFSGGLRYSLSGQSSFLGGISAGVFNVSGASKKAEWKGNGVTLAADVFL